MPRRHCTPSGPQWAVVKGGHLRSSTMSPDLLYDGTDFYEFDAPRIDTGHDHGAGDTLAGRDAAHWPTAIRCPTRWRSPSAGSPNASGPPIRWARATARCPRCSGCRSDLDLDEIAGVAHEPDGEPTGVVVADPRRRRQPGVADADPHLRRVGRARLAGGALQPAVPATPPEGAAVGFGGHRPGRASSRRSSWPAPLSRRPGARRRTLLRRPDDLDGRRRRQPALDGLTLFSYPLHPPGKPERARTEHLPRHHRPDGVHPRHRGPVRHHRGAATAAAALVAGPTEIVEVTGARHDLGSKTLDVPTLAVDAALILTGQ